MRVAILEWICGGGLWETPAEQMDAALLMEGWAMLAALAHDFVAGGHQVSACIDARLYDRLTPSEFLPTMQTIPSGGWDDGLPGNWRGVASEAEAVVLIAPEFFSILQTATKQLASACRVMLNCTGKFLDASCDKWLTAQRLFGTGVSHPATQLVSEVTTNWIQQNRIDSGKWIMKPRDGAGCDSLQLVPNDLLNEVLEVTRSNGFASRMIIQPLYHGMSFSRSAIIDSTGSPNWLPLVTQEFRVDKSMAYTGGRVLKDDHSHYTDPLSGQQYAKDHLDKFLNQALGALGQGARGWVGVDLVYSHELMDWVLIEVNPRLTTSFAGLSMAYGPGLTEQMLRAARGLQVKIGTQWQVVAFDAAGNPRC